MPLNFPAAYCGLLSNIIEANKLIAYKYLTLLTHQYMKSLFHSSIHFKKNKTFLCATEIKHCKISQSLKN